MEKKKPWFLDRYSEKNISRSFKSLGYSSLIFSLICLLVAIFNELKVVERLYWAVGGFYLLPLGLGIVLRKEWGRKLTIAFPFVIITALGVLLTIGMIPYATDHNQPGWLTFLILLPGLIIFLILLCATTIVWLTFGRKYYNHPNVKNYFNR